LSPQGSLHRKPSVVAQPSAGTSSAATNATHHFGLIDSSSVHLAARGGPGLHNL
jgi:hypothetical protein